MRRSLSVPLLALLCGALHASAFAALELSTDHRSLFFGLMQVGEEKTLAQAGSFQNEITCSSTGGVTWYLKISVLQPLASGVETIPLDQFGWELVATDGHGSVASRNRPTAFSLLPAGPRKRTLSPPMIGSTASVS